MLLAMRRAKQKAPLGTGRVCYVETPNTERHNHRGFAADRVSFRCNTCPQNKGAPTEADALHLVISRCEVSRMDGCHNCKRELFVIENDGLHLTGCLTCNLWAPVEGDRWVQLSEEDLHTLHKLRHRGLDRMPSTKGSGDPKAAPS